jgi:hypothetical protein
MVTVTVGISVTVTVLLWVPSLAVAVTVTLVFTVIIDGAVNVLVCGTPGLDGVVLGAARLDE